MSKFIDTDNMKEFIKLNKQALYKDGMITLSNGAAYNSLLSGMKTQKVCRCVSDKTTVIIIKRALHTVNPNFTVYIESSIPEL